MIEINLLKQGHGILYRQKYIKRTLAHRRIKVLLLLILLLSSIAIYLTPTKPSNFNKLLLTKLFSNLDTIWFEESASPFKIWFEEKILFLSNKIFIQQLMDYASGITESIFPQKETIQEGFFYIRVASGQFSEDIYAVQKDLLSKGFQSDQGTYRELIDKFHVIIDITQAQDNVDSLLAEINAPDIAWEIQISEDKGSEIISQAFFSLNEAKQLEELIRTKGFKGKVTKINVPVVFNEIRTGNFKSREQAVRLLNQLQKAGIEGTIIKQ